MSEASTRPVVRLKPKVPGRKFRNGVPWAYQDEVVWDRRTRAIPPGTLVTLEDGERKPIAAAVVNPNSKLSVRLMDLDLSADLGRDWLQTRISAALALREVIYGAPFYRLINAEADGLPGVIVDRFGDALVLQANAAWAEMRIDALVDVLADTTGCSSIYKNSASRTRALEGLDGASAFVRGGVDGPIAVQMNGATYFADLEHGQKTGLFYDQRENQAFAARFAKGRTVADVFSHVGGFGLAALAAGAASVVAVDQSQAALDHATRGASEMGFGEEFEAVQSDAVKALKSFAEEDKTFGLTVCDPPAFAPTRATAEAGLRGYRTVAEAGARVTEKSGFLVLCSCSQSVAMSDFRTACLTGIARAGRVAQLLHTGSAGPDHPLHPYLADAAYLKALFFRLD